MIVESGTINNLKFNRGLNLYNKFFLTLELRLTKMGKGSKKLNIVIENYTYNDRFVDLQNDAIDVLEIGMYNYQLVVNGNHVLTAGIMRVDRANISEKDDNEGVSTPEDTEINGERKYKYFNG